MDHQEISDPGQLPADPKVSVIVITYGHEQTLAQAIDSIAAQRTSFPFEIVIAEDCSPDGTRAVALDLQRKYPQLVRVAFSERNRGMIPNLHFAIRLARAPFIANCEGDDYWIDPDKLERQIAMLEANPGVDMAFTRGVRAYSDGRQEAEPAWDYGPEPRIVSARELFSGFAWVLPVASFVWRSEVTRQLPDWFDAAPFTDLVLIMAASVRGGAAYDPAETVAYRIAHEASFTVRLRDADSGARAHFLQRAIDLLERACRHYGFPRRHLAHRLADYRLALVKELVALRGYGEASRQMLRVPPSFLLGGAARRLRRLGRAPAQPVSSSV